VTVEAHITLYGDDARRFFDIQSSLSTEKKREIGNADTLRELMDRSEF
jgi:hypothetical protein